MEPVLLDTDIISFILKGDVRVEPYHSLIENRVLIVSFMSVAELFQWAEIRSWGESRKQQLEDSLKNYVVLPFDLVLCKQWAKIRAQCQRAGHPISPQDAWIAATAIQYRIALVTHNLSDFEPVEGLRLLRVP